MRPLVSAMPSRPERGSKKIVVIEKSSQATETRRKERDDLKERVGQGAI